MEKNLVINAAQINIITGIPIRDVRKWLAIYPGAIRLSALGVNRPRLGIREKGVEAFLDWLAKQPKEPIPKREPGPKPKEPPTKTRKRPNAYGPSNGPIPYRKAGGGKP